MNHQIKNTLSIWFYIMASCFGKIGGQAVTRHYQKVTVGVCILYWQPLLAADLSLAELWSRFCWSTPRLVAMWVFARLMGICFKKFFVTSSYSSIAQLFSY